ncbi:MAG: AAA family ATPase, partial [Rickettsiaceae bacterium]|nr:AAA family ATPase [Rickettsiaceae bacterium]
NHSLGITTSSLDSKTLLERALDKAKILANEYLGEDFKEIILSDRQKKVALDILNDKYQISVIEGLPGAGKTTLMRKISSQYKKHGYNVIGVAVSNVASRELGLSANLDNWMNITQFRYKLENLSPGEFEGKLNLKMDYYKNEDSRSQNKTRLLSNKTVLIIDEASQVDLTEMHYIIREVQNSGAKLILLGDSNQLSSISSLGAYEKISEIFLPKRLEEVKRQENQLHREATKLLAQFKIPDAIKLYRKTGCFRFEDNLDRAKDRLARDYIDEYIRIYNEKASSLIQDKIIALAYTNLDVTSLNLSIREKLIERGVISSLSQTYHITRQGISCLIQIAKGDQIVFTKNNNYLSISNSDIAEVVGFGSRLDKRNNKLNKTIIVKITTNIDKNSLSSIFTPENRIIEIDNHYFKGFDYGYAKNIYKSQGKTYDKVFGLIDSHTGYNMFNVMATRHRKNLKLYGATDVLQDALYRKISLNPVNAKLEYMIKADKDDDMSDKYAGLISLIQRRGDTSLSIDHISKLYQKDQEPEGDQKNPKTPEEILIDYIDIRNSLIKTRQAIDRWLELEQAKGRIHHYNDHPYIKDLNDLLEMRKNLASQITDNYQTYKKLLTQSQINYSTIEKHAHKNEYKYYFNKAPHNGNLVDLLELPLLIKTIKSIGSSINKPGSLNEIEYQLLLAEINHSKQSLKEITNNLISQIEEHKLSIINLDLEYKSSIDAKALAIDKIKDGKNYLNCYIKDYLSHIYQESPDQILETYEKLEHQGTKSDKIKKIKQNPSLLGNIKGISLFGLSITKARENATDHLKSIDDKLIKYEEYKTLIPSLEEKLESNKLDREIKKKEIKLKSLQNKLPPFHVEEFITKANIISKDPDNKILLSWITDELTASNIESFDAKLKKEELDANKKSNQATSKKNNNLSQESKIRSKIESEYLPASLVSLAPQNKKQYLKERDKLLEKYESSTQVDDSAKLYRNIAGSLQPDLSYKILKNLVFKEISKKDPAKAIFVIVGQDLLEAKKQELDQIKDKLLTCCQNILSYDIEKIELATYDQNSLNKNNQNSKNNQDIKNNQESTNREQNHQVFSGLSQDFIKRILEDQLLDAKDSVNLTFTAGDYLRLEIDRNKLSRIIINERIKHNIAKDFEINRREIINVQDIYAKREKLIKSTLRTKDIARLLAKENPAAARIFAENLVDAQLFGDNISFAQNIEEQKEIARITAITIESDAKDNEDRISKNSLYKIQKIFSKDIISDNNKAREEYIKYRVNHAIISSSKDIGQKEQEHNLHHKSNNHQENHANYDPHNKYELHIKSIIEKEIHKTDQKLHSLNKEYKIQREHEIQDDLTRHINRQKTK